MRWGSLFSTVLLAGGSIMLPRMFAKTTGIDTQSLGALVSQVQKQDSGAALDAQAAKAWNDLEDGKIDNISLEQLASVQDAAGQTGDPMSALLTAFKTQQPLGNQWRGTLLRNSETVRQWYRSHRGNVLSALNAAGLTLIAVALLGAAPPLRGLARFLLEMAFSLSGRWLLLLSLAATAYFAAARLNPWPLFPHEILAAPVTCMLLCGVCLRVLDPNYPVWNTMVWSFLAPIAAGIGIKGWLRLKSASSA